MLAVDPIQLLVVEYGGTFVYSAYRELGDKLVHSEYFLFGFRGPSKHGYVVDDAFRYVSLLEECLETDSSVSL